MNKIKTKYLLGVETTCDETGIAIIKKQKDRQPIVIENLLYSSEKIHKKTKGVVPEVAARYQVKKIFPLLKKINKAKKIANLNGIAVSSGPGLVGSLLVGINLAKTLSYTYNLPLLSVNHVKAHLYGSFLSKDKVKLPAIGLVVSGGHTNIMYLKNQRQIKILGSTCDDAAGEAFDKVGALLGLGYPGGPEIEKIAQKAKKNDKYKFPRPMIESGDFNFSFSGLKTAVLQEVKKKQLKPIDKAEIANSFQKAVSQVICQKLKRAILEYRPQTVILGGGVISNTHLREKIEEIGLVKTILPAKKFCTDNGAVIAARGSYLLEAKKTTSWRQLEVSP